MTVESDPGAPERPRSFFRQDDTDVFVPTAAAGSPWGPTAQHAGPAAALLARGIEEHVGPAGLRPTRVTVDVLAPVPMRPLRIRVSTIRPGRRTQLIEAVGESEQGPVLVARAWCIVPTPADYPHRPLAADAPTKAALQPQPIRFPGAYLHGYLAAIDWCFHEGGFDSLGPAKVWARQRLPLLVGETPTAWQRVLAVADSSYGASLCLDLAQFPMINTDLSVLLSRDPVGEWIGLDTHTATAPLGAAINTAIVHDLGGQVGALSQTLFAHSPTVPATT